MFATRAIKFFQEDSFSSVVVEKRQVTVAAEGDETRRSFVVVMPQLSHRLISNIPTAELWATGSGRVISDEETKTTQSGLFEDSPLTLPVVELTLTSA